MATSRGHCPEHSTIMSPTTVSATGTSGTSTALAGFRHGPAESFASGVKVVSIRYDRFEAQPHAVARAKPINLYLNPTVTAASLHSQTTRSSASGKSESAGDSRTLAALPAQIVVASAHMRIALGLITAIMAQAATAAAIEADAPRTWGIGALGVQATEWRVTTHGIESGAMATLYTAGASATRLASGIGAQSFAIGGGEGGFQAEYLNRFAYGVRFWRFDDAAFVLRGGFNFDILSTPHGGNFELGPLVDVGYQSVSASGYLDVSLQTVIPIIPAAFSDNGNHKTEQWFSVGPHVGLGQAPFYVDGNVSRTAYEGELRTEFHLAVCGVAGPLLCARLRNFRYDDGKKPVTLLGLFVGFGDAGPPKRK
jgi:hypothetical protein